MYLKKLELAGFKSFPEKVEFTFSPGITATVGPNGCGKSNLMDGVRWVLGSQSPRLLRGSQMDELIFTGTAKRRPMNYAEVSITFADASGYLPIDYSELRITRRMYRSGEGEYYINKNACRLRDIVELFLDTGIGTETYSLIGQGRVEQLINARPEDHRELFEEAARIHKYRRRKKETLNRLEEANQNLIRVEDLCQELQNQQEPLAEAASVAKQFAELRDRLFEVEQKILARQWIDNMKRQHKANGESKRLAESLQELAAQQATLKGSLAENNSKEKGEKERLEQEQASQQEREKQLQQLESRLAVVREQKNFSLEKGRLKENALREVWERIAGLEKTLAQNRDELEQLAQEQQEHGSRAADLREKLKQLQQEQDLPALEKIRSQSAEIASRLTTLKQALEDKKTRRAELLEMMEDLNGRVETARTQQEQASAQQKENGAMLERLRWEEEQWSREQSHLAGRRSELKARLEKSRSGLEIMEREQEKKANRVRYLRESEDNFSFYAGGVKAVMQAATGGALAGIHGPVASLITVPPNLEKAVEVALGGAVQNIVSADDEAARRAIEFLKKERAGRATFLPLNLLKVPGRRELPTAAGREGLLGVAARLVKVEEEYARAVDYLLGGVLVIKDLETALKIARVNKSGWKLVTLDGEVINPGGAISGGHQPREGSGILQRRREMTELEREMGERQKDITAARAALDKIKEDIKHLEEKTAANEQAGKELDKRKLKLQGEGENAGRELKLFTEEERRLSRELEKWQLKEAVLAGDLEHGLEEQSRLEGELATLKEEESRLGEQLRQSEAALRTTENELVELRVRISAIQEKESTLQEQQARYLQERNGLQNLAAELVREKETLQGERERQESNEVELTKEIREAAAELELRQKQLFEFTAALNRLARIREELAEKLEQVEKNMEKYERRSRSLELELVKLEEAARYLEEHAREKFDLDPRQEHEALEIIAVEAGPSGDLEVLREQLAGQMGAMGTVNTAVIGEYERLEERINFLQEQRQDLLEGEKGIKKVLAELDQHMKEQFLETFEILAKHFNDVFQRLFDGGQALLRLTDPQNVLESGIEIVAQPPGKNLKNISLLSGGEKALTAIALLFALLKHRPVPFCILDEIDSSLDDSNAGRFINMLKSFSGETQFILITHRRHTMEEADVLYGVTMEEEGVSKVISIDMKQQERAG